MKFSIGAERAFSNSFIAFLLLLEYGNCAFVKDINAGNKAINNKKRIILAMECA